jgi:hypothetical protein
LRVEEPGQVVDRAVQPSSAATGGGVGGVRAARLPVLRPALCAAQSSTGVAQQVLGIRPRLARRARPARR